jgi:uncharacterized DUF497 family protein
MKFEFDPEKSETNRSKHGIDFVEGQALWDDPDRLQVHARTQGEPRLMLIGSISSRLWTAIFTFRKGTIRIISIRRSRKKEVEQYED